MSEKITQAHLDELRNQVEYLRQGLWDVYRELGFDTDGDPTPAAVQGDLVKLVVDATKEYRKDEEEGYDDLNTARLTTFSYLMDVARLHSKSYADTSDEAWNRNPVCSHSGHAWPCETYKALGAVPEEGNL